MTINVPASSEGTITLKYHNLLKTFQLIIFHDYVTAMRGLTKPYKHEMDYVLARKGTRIGPVFKKYGTPMDWLEKRPLGEGPLGFTIDLHTQVA